jgi:uncharacterized protein YeaO (DUF488 family)
MTILIDKHCRLTSAPEDGIRILTMRYWPRGIKRDRFDVWLRELAPSVELLKWCKSEEGRGLLDPEVYYRTWRAWYRGELIEQRPLIEELRHRHEAGEIISLLCHCHVAAKCHRSVLSSLILGTETGSG